MLSVGRKANLSRVGLDKLNIELHRNGVKVDEHLLTSHPCVYACGDITGYSLLAHTAIREAEVAINHILGVEDRMNYDCVPGVVYTNPEVAGVGKTEEELHSHGQSNLLPTDILSAGVSLPNTLIMRSWYVAVKLNLVSSIVIFHITSPLKLLMNQEKGNRVILSK